MKKIISVALIVIVALSLFCFTSCDDDDYYETHGYTKKQYDEVYDYYNKNYNSNYRG